MKHKICYSRNINVHDIVKAQLAIFRCLQRICFSDSLALLKLGKQLPKTNSLTKLRPFLDSTGLMRVGGRLANSLIPYNAKHPILLPSSTHVTRIYVENFHLLLGHLGREAVLARARSHLHSRCNFFN